MNRRRSGWDAGSARRENRPAEGKLRDERRHFSTDPIQIHVGQVPIETSTDQVFGEEHGLLPHERAKGGAPPDP